MFKRALSLIICFVMLISTLVGTGLTLSANESAADTEQSGFVADTPAASSSVSASKNEGVVTPDRATTGTCGANLTWSLDTSTGVLTISGTGYMTDYSDSSSSYYAPWYSNRSYVKKVIIGDSVASIGSYAFYYCYNLTSVTIPDSVTSIGSYAFYYCTSLTNVTIPDSVTSIGDYVFYWCTSLTSVYITDIAAWCGIEFGNPVANPLCYAEKFYLIGNLITDLIIPDSVTSIGSYAFYNCKSLTSITIPDSVTSIGRSAFYNCYRLTSVTIGNSVTSIGYESFYDTAYYNNSSNWIDSVLYIGNHLIEAKSSISGAYSVKEGTICIGDWAFSDCDALTSVTIPDSVTSIGGSAFSYCTSLISVTLPNSVANIDSSAFSCCFSLTNVTIPDSVTSIGDYAFSDCTSLTSVTIPDSVSNIGSSAFSACDSLTSVTIPNSVTTINNNSFEYCTSLTSVTIPDSVTSIGRSAFEYCTSLTSVTIPDSVTSIGNRAFYSCNSLTSMTIPDSVTSIGSEAIHYYNNGYKPLNLTIICYVNSYAHTYAKNNGFKYEILCDHVFTNYIPDNNTTCTEDGTKTAYCDNGCGSSDVKTVPSLGHSFTVYTDIAATCIEDAYSIAYCDNGCGAVDVIAIEGTAFGHTWSEWITSLDPTYTAEGEKIRFCLTCKLTEGEKIPALEPPYNPDKPVITVDNFTVTITNADNIKDMRYALGEYTTTAEIRNAEGNVALDNGVVSANTLDGNFIYEMPNGGHYTIWIRMKDGTNYILPLDVTNVTASVSTYGVKITVHDIYNVKDIYIAKGEYQTYREIKDNGYIVALSANKIGGKHDYTYTVYEPGVHTILVRYNDGRNVLFHEELTVTEPTFETNGLQVTVGNIEDVKVIRTAYGEYNTPGDTKRAAGARNFSGKSVIKGAEEYMIQYREDGMVTIIVEYNNGYIKVFHYNVQHKQADCMQTMSTVLFDNLDGFVIIRYAPGEYTSSAEIKRAKGSKYIKPADLTGEYAIVSGLAKGTYTFCVQFDDDSYNYFAVTVD